MTTLEEEQQRVAQGRMSGGTTCGCCGLWVQAYRETITSTMAVVLDLLYQSTQGQLVEDVEKHGYTFVDVNALIAKFSAEHSPQFTKKVGGRWAKLRYWGLIEPLHENVTGGMWRITKKGKSFRQGMLLPAVMVVFNGDVLGMDATKTITWEQARKDRFNLGTLTGPVTPPDVYGGF